MSATTDQAIPLRGRRVAIIVASIIGVGAAFGGPSLLREADEQSCNGAGIYPESWRVPACTRQIAREAADPEMQAITLLMRGEILAQRGDHAGAAADFTASLRILPAAGTHHHRALSRLALGDIAGARADLDEALRLAPRRMESYRERAAIRWALGDEAGAAEDAASADRLSRRDIRRTASRTE